MRPWRASTKRKRQLAACCDLQRRHAWWSGRHPVIGRRSRTCGISSSRSSDPATALDEVFDAWARVHEVVRATCIEDPGGMADTLEGNLTHLAIHRTTMERLLGQ